MKEEDFNNELITINDIKKPRKYYQNLTELVEKFKWKSITNNSDEIRTYYEYVDELSLFYEENYSLYIDMEVDTKEESEKYAEYSTLLKNIYNGLKQLQNKAIEINDESINNAITCYLAFINAIQKQKFFFEISPALEKNKETAIAFIRKHAKKHNDSAMNALLELYNNKILKENIEERGELEFSILKIKEIQLYLNNEKDTTSIFKKSMILMEENRGTRDIRIKNLNVEICKRMLEQAAKLGEVKAWFQVGELFDGSIFYFKQNKNIIKAFKYYKIFTEKSNDKESDAYKKAISFIEEKAFSELTSNVQNYFKKSDKSNLEEKIEIGEDAYSLAGLYEKKDEEKLAFYYYEMAIKWGSSLAESWTFAQKDIKKQYWIGNLYKSLYRETEELTFLLKAKYFYTLALKSEEKEIYFNSKNNLYDTEIETLVIDKNKNSLNLLANIKKQIQLYKEKKIFAEEQFKAKTITWEMNNNICSKCDSEISILEKSLPDNLCNEAKEYTKKISENEEFYLPMAVNQYIKALQIDQNHETAIVELIILAKQYPSIVSDKFQLIFKEKNISFDAFKEEAQKAEENRKEKKRLITLALFHIDKNTKKKESREESYFIAQSSYLKVLDLFPKDSDTLSYLDALYEKLYIGRKKYLIFKMDRDFKRWVDKQPQERQASIYAWAIYNYIFNIDKKNNFNYISEKDNNIKYIIDLLKNEKFTPEILSKIQDDENYTVVNTVSNLFYSSNLDILKNLQKKYDNIYEEKKFLNLKKE